MSADDFYFENQLVKQYWSPCSVDGEIDLDKVDGSDDFSIIPVNSRKKINLEVGELRDIIRETIKQTRIKYTDPEKVSRQAILDLLNISLKTKLHEFEGEYVICKSTMERTRMRINKDQLESLNSCGEFQGVGDRIDRVVAELILLRRLMNDVKKLEACK